ncbi:MAG: 1-deoxy-D-xylulose-5-phosphate reductoisomerase, partial [Blastocatellia bacterium]
RGERREEVKRLILTASGGPFRTKTKEEIERADRRAALDHPNWKMGEKISIDSATLMNKGLEVIEAHWLFGFEPEQISVVVHPQSIIHSMIELADGSIIAQLGVTDMRHPIQYALTYPERRKNSAPPLDLTAISALTFEEPDLERFPCLGFAYQALALGGTAPAALNAANEVAVRAFLEGKIGFGAIPEINRKVLESHNVREPASIEDVHAADTQARRRAIIEIERLASDSFRQRAEAN